MENMWKKPPSPNVRQYPEILPVKVAQGSKAWIVFARADAVIVGSNPTQGMDVSYVSHMCLFWVCALLYLGRGLATSWSLDQGILTIVNRSGDWKAVRAHKGCRTIKKYPDICIEVLRKLKKISFMIVGVRAEVQTENLSSTNQKFHRFNRLISYEADLHVGSV
jgi:hypothetical protein